VALLIGRLYEVYLKDYGAPHSNEVARFLEEFYRKYSDGFINVPTWEEIKDEPARYYVLYDDSKTTLEEAVIGVGAVRIANGYIKRVVIRKDMRGRGLGKLLLTHLISVAANRNDHVTLHVRKNNTVMRHIVEKLGFQIKEEDENSYLYELRVMG